MLKMKQSRPPTPPSARVHTPRSARSVASTTSRVRIEALEAQLAANQQQLADAQAFAAQSQAKALAVDLQLQTESQRRQDLESLASGLSDRNRVAEQTALSAQNTVQRLRRT